MADEHMPQYKDLKLNDDVTITLPAHIWQGFYAAYLSADWNDYYANVVANAGQEQMLDPIYLREREAHAQEQAEHAHAHALHFFGQGPDPDEETANQFDPRYPPEEPS
jgi:hypothetical protein